MKSLREKRYRIGIASKEYVKQGVAGGFKGEVGRGMGRVILLPARPA